MLKVVIVDDERLARVALLKALRPFADVDVVAEADSVEAAAEQVVRHDPDVVFLDVKLPDGTGFDLFDRVDVRGHVVFQTAYSDYAVRAFEVNALDYLVKPPDSTQVDRALRRARRATPSVDTESVVVPWRRVDRVPLQEGKRMRFCRVRDIAYIQAAQNYTEIHLSSGQTAMVNQGLRHWESRLPDGFVRIHRSTVINLELSEELLYADGKWQVRLQGCPEPLTVSRRFAQALKARVAAGEGGRST